MKTLFNTALLSLIVLASFNTSAQAIRKNVELDIEYYDNLQNYKGYNSNYVSDENVDLVDCSIQKAFSLLDGDMRYSNVGIVNEESLIKELKNEVIDLCSKEVTELFNRHVEAEEYIAEHTYYNGASEDEIQKRAEGAVRRVIDRSMTDAVGMHIHAPEEKAKLLKEITNKSKTIIERLKD